MKWYAMHVLYRNVKCIQIWEWIERKKNKINKTHTHLPLWVLFQQFSRQTSFWSTETVTSAGNGLFCIQNKRKSPQLFTVIYFAWKWLLNKIIFLFLIRSAQQERERDGERSVHWFPWISCLVVWRLKGQGRDWLLQEKQTDRDPERWTSHPCVAFDTSVQGVDTSP